MQTSFTPAQLADSHMASSEKIVRTCVHCGFCTATCPTYQLLGDLLTVPLREGTSAGIGTLTGHLDEVILHQRGKKQACARVLEDLRSRNRPRPIAFASVAPAEGTGQQPRLRLRFARRVAPATTTRGESVARPEPQQFVGERSRAPLARKRRERYNERDAGLAW